MTSLRLFVGSLERHQEAILCRTVRTSAVNGSRLLLSRSQNGTPDPEAQDLVAGASRAKLPTRRMDSFLLAS